MNFPWAERNDLAVVQAFLAKEEGSSIELGKRLAVVAPKVRAHNRCLTVPLAPGAVEDLTQMILLDIVKRLPTFDGRSPLGAWAGGFVALHFYKHFTARSKERHLMTELGERLEENNPDQQTPTEKDLEISQEVQAVLATLPPEDRALLTYRIYRNWTFPKIAAHLGRPESGIKARFRRLVLRLRDRLGPYWQALKDEA